MTLHRLAVPLLLIVVLSSCQLMPPADPTPVAALQNTAAATSIPTATLTPAPTAVYPAFTVTPDAEPRMTPERWREWPVIPAISTRSLEIYDTGLAYGNDSHAFSKVGDCESRATWFLYDFDQGMDAYSLGSFITLMPVIRNYPGSFERLSEAAKSGFNAAAVLSPTWADKANCLKGESPLACEYRIHRPALVLINLGTNDVPNREHFEENLRKVIEFSIERGVLPVLATKADNLEGDNSINAAIARLAYEYDIPLWNFWLAVQPLPGHGLQSDGAHLTFAGNRFDDPLAMQNAWPVRNLTALQVLQSIMLANGE